MPVSLLIGIVFFISPPHQLYWFFCNLVENMSIQEIGQKNEHMFKCQRTYVLISSAVFCHTLRQAQGDRDGMVNLHTTVKLMRA